MTSIFGRKISVFITSLLAIAVLMLPISAGAATITDLNNQKDYYTKQAEAARKAAALKAQQAAEIQTQISNVNNQISTTEQSLATTGSQIDQTQADIVSLEGQIGEQEDKLASEQDKMGKLISSWYMEGESGLLESVLSADTLTEVVNRQEYYESIRQQVETQIAAITEIRDNLNAEKAEKDQRLLELNGLKSSQTDQMSYLETRKVMKSRLLSDTNGAITDLKAEEQSAQAMVAQLQANIDKIRALGHSGGQIVSSNDSGWYYSQLDSRWSGIEMGNYATIGMYGCLITSLTMIANFYGSSITPEGAVAKSAFVHGGRNDGALISTPIVSDGGSQAIDWDKVDDELSHGHPVVAGVALGVDMGNSYGVSHFVVIKSKIGTNKYAMHDPLGDGRGYNMSQVKAMRIVRP